MSMSMVRLALVTSVMCTPPLVPPVKLYKIQVSTVPNMHRPSSTACFTSGMFSRSHTSFTALKYVLRGSPHFFFRYSLS
uniref:Putative secreted protein n=1 Tax=Ixodes ricinus TaxID=34613 RepID=A0A6B0U5T3_IXORI